MNVNKGATRKWGTVLKIRGGNGTTMKTAKEARTGKKGSEWHTSKKNHINCYPRVGVVLSNLKGALGLNRNMCL